MLDMTCQIKIQEMNLNNCIFLLRRYIRFFSQYSIYYKFTNIIILFYYVKHYPIVLAGSDKKYDNKFFKKKCFLNRSELQLMDPQPGAELFCDQ